MSEFNAMIKGLENSIAYITHLRITNEKSESSNIGYRNNLKHLSKLIRAALNNAKKLRQLHNIE